MQFISRGIVAGVLAVLFVALPASAQDSNIRVQCKDSTTLHPTPGDPAIVLSKRARYRFFDADLFDSSENAESFTSFSGSYAFAGSFDGEAISGSMVCKGVEGCLFSDDGGAFSEWMARYLPNKSDGVGWPAYVVQGEDGRTIKLVSSVGFIDLRQGTNNPTVHRYQAEIGNGRILDVEFSRMD